LVKFKNQNQIYFMFDLEAIIGHFAETLNRWRKNFYECFARGERDGIFKGVYLICGRFYFLYCEAGFLERNIGDVQMVFAKSGARDVRVEY
jgi:Cyclopropane fatty acid synthase and related methyltransferases